MPQRRTVGRGEPRRGREPPRLGVNPGRPVGDGPAAIAWLEELGCAFTREDGNYRVARCGGASRKRLLQIGDRTGNAIVKALRSGLGAPAR